VLLTGAFQSSSWMEHHLTPMAASTACRSITIVTAGDVPPLPKVTAVRPPAWLSAIAGETAARLAMFAALGLRRRPHVVGGFHLLFNGLLAGLVAPLAGSRSMYFCVGGPAEMLDGGLLAENRLFNRLRAPDPAIERLLVRAATAFDVVVTMGSRAATFLTDRGATGTVHVIPGGLDDTRYRPSTAPPETDVMFVGRLEPIKRPELLLDALAVVATRNPNLRATLVGDGQLRSALERKARDLGIDRLVTFAGRCADVHDRLPRARVFVLTSRSEGVALSLMEALACGVPAVAPRVGDLEDVLVDGVNGFLIDDHTAEAFAARISSLLEDEALRSRLGVAARTMAGGYELRAVAHRWDAALRGEPAGAGYSAGASACSMRATMAGSSR
jgi:glycosyltransferase involved in cell wall biosynthesis